MWSTERPHLCVISFYPTLSASFDCCDEFVYTWHRSQRALKETLESLPPNQSVSPFTCWSICVLICLRPGSPRWTVINVEDERGSPVLFSLLLHALVFKCICTLNDGGHKIQLTCKIWTVASSVSWLPGVQTVLVCVAVCYLLIWLLDEFIYISSLVAVQSHLVHCGLTTLST